MNFSSYSSNLHAVFEELLRQQMYGKTKYGDHIQTPFMSAQKVRDEILPKIQEKYGESEQLTILDKHVKEHLSDSGEYAFTAYPFLMHQDPNSINNINTKAHLMWNAIYEEYPNIEFVLINDECSVIYCKK